MHKTDDLKQILSNTILNTQKFISLSWSNRTKLFKFLIIATSFCSLYALSGCRSSSNGGGPIHHDPYYQAWYDVYGHVCGYNQPGPGCNYYANGLKIIDVEDPSFSNNSYYLAFDDWYYYNSYGQFSIYTGWAWKSPTGIIYDDFGNALNNDDGVGQDYAGDVAEREDNVIHSAADYLAAKYGLSATTGLKVAKFLNDWAQEGRTRTLSESDIASATEGLYGISFGKLKNALLEAKLGERQPLNELINEAATNWATTPETLKEILKSWYGNQMDQL